MGFAAQMVGGLRELHQGFAREGFAVILGRNLKVVIPEITRRKKREQSDFIGIYDLTVRVDLSDFTGLDPENALESEISFNGKRFRIKEYRINEARIYFGAESLNS
jgi:hypothetical protein